MIVQICRGARLRLRRTSPAGKAELVDLSAEGGRKGLGMFYVYVLQSLKDQRLYIGMTSNLEERVKRHNAGCEKSTRGRVPFKLLHSEVFGTRTEARDREKYLKSGFGREIIKKLLT